MVDTACTSDADCAALTVLDGAASQVAFACVSARCVPVLAAGQPCAQPSDCAQYQWAMRALTANSSSAVIADFIGGSTSDTSVPANFSLGGYLADLCAPAHCTIASTCEKDYASLFSSADTLSLPSDQTSLACCAGGSESDVSRSLTTLYCLPANLVSTTWIGVLISIIGSVCNNLGLNLQALATRNRKKKQMLADLLKRRQQSAAGGRKIFFPTIDSRSFSLYKTLSLLRNRAGSSASTALSDRTTVADPATHSVVAQPAAASALLETDHNPDAIDVPDGALPVQSTHSEASPQMQMEIEDDEQPVDERFDKKMNFAQLVRNPVWVLGLIIYTFANFLNFAALQFAPQSLIAPLGSISLVVNAVAAPWINKEKMFLKDILGGILIVGGSSMTVAFAGVNNTDYNLCILLKLFQNPATIVFLTATAALLVFFFVYISVVEKNVERRSMPVSTTEIEDAIVAVGLENEDSEFRQVGEFITAGPSPNDPVPTIISANATAGQAGAVTELSNDPIKPHNAVRRFIYRIIPVRVLNRITLLFGRIKLIPRLRTPIPATSRRVKIFLPLAYAALGGLMGTLTTLFAKSTIHLLTNSFLGTNQFTNFNAWIIAGITVFTALGQVYWINAGLERYDALLQIPVFFVVWTVFDVVGGGIYFDEFSGFTARQYALFIFAIAVIFAGVGVLADRLRK
ncbi:NIPA-like protein 3 [Entophlyctis luteolus]|nr:NIPA-like protein 3 [Entophlyctis luteolus]